MMLMTLPICPRYPYVIQMVSIGYLYGMCRSYFDSKAVYFAIRPMCHKRGLRVSGGQCGPVCAMWCFFIEQAGVDEPKPYFLPGKKKKPGSFHHPAKFAQFHKCQQKKTRERAQNLRTTVFLYWIKYWLKTLVPVQTPPRVGTTTAASRYNHRRL